MSIATDAHKVQVVQAMVEDESPDYLREQILTYIGNKRALLGFIGTGLEEVRRRLQVQRITAFDVFSGSGIVARFLKRFSTHLYTCDLEGYSRVINTCYLANRSEVDSTALAAAIDHVNAHANAHAMGGIISELYAPADDHAIQPGERVFYSTRNARFLDGARQAIAGLDPALQPFVLAPLLYQASVHSNTSGVFKGFYKNSATGIGQFGGNGRHALTRILTDISVPYPVFSAFSAQHTHVSGDANEVARQVPSVDVAYLDPPYNQHPYGSNYFMLNLLVDYQRPPSISAVSGIPAGWNRSLYNVRASAGAAFADLAQTIAARFLLVSSNSESFIPHQEMLAILARLGTVQTWETRYNAFRGSRNLRARDLHVTEYLYLLDRR